MPPPPAKASTTAVPSAPAPPLTTICRSRKSMPYHRQSAIQDKRGRREISIIGARGNQGAAPAPGVAGGATSGPGLARGPAGRGLRVVLVEQNDLASATSSASS